ncbi:MAG: hypothetical protein ACREQH_14415 [Candidatus Binatus sp.]
MKRIFAILTVALFAATLAIPAFAKGTNQQIKTAQKGATNSSLVAIDPGLRLAFVARQQLGDVTGDGLVDVISLKGNPNKKDLRKTTIDLGHPDKPIGVAVDVVNHVLLVASGDNGGDGKLDVIQEKNFQPFPGSPFAYPAGSDTGKVGQLTFDPIRKKVIVATITTGSSSDHAANATTGFAVFDELTDMFGPVIPAASSDNFAFNAITNVVISPADFLDPPIDAVDIANNIGCTSDPADTNLMNQMDSDGAGFDPATNVVVVGDDNSHTATVVNLNGSTFANEGSPPCTLLEGGAAPNSVNITTSFDDPAGIAVNLKTHQALLEASGGAGVALAQLPKTPVTQIDSTTTFLINQSTLPNDPNNSAAEIFGFPYSAAIDPKRNLGYGDSNDTFLVQVSLKALQKKPSGISNPLPSGNCKGTTTTLGCSNGGGVTFFPLSDTSTE